MQVARAGLQLRGAPLRHMYRCRRQPQLPAQRLRRYSTLPTQDHLNQTFSTPLAHFLHTISRIARIIVFTSTGVALVGAGAYEGVHQYVEHVAMPRTQAQKKGKEGSSEEDAWGWLQESREEDWFHGSGTDPRLGMRGRHTLRGAWIYANWGGGISPTTFISAGAGLPTNGRDNGKVNITVEEGLRQAETFLRQTLIIAEEKGIRIPDLAAMRAGIYTSTAEAASKPLDWTAITLECKLASIRERLGTVDALKGALSGYTRVYDVLAHVDSTNRAMQVEGHTSGREPIPAERLIRLATKIGDLHAFLGNRAEAESWLLQAVGTAGQEASHMHEEKAREGIVRNQIIAGVGGLTSLPVEVEEAKEAVLHLKVKEPLKHATQLPLLLSSQSPSPGLTRSLISTLLSLSAFYAQPEDRKQLEQALQFPASALRLARVEKARLGLSDHREQVGPSLHTLWLAHHDALASVHIAETTYALRNRGAVATSFAGFMSSIGLAAKEDRHAQTLQWLAEADENASSVAQKLGKSFSKPGKPTQPTQLLEKWAGDVQYEVPAKRLLRDSVRLKLAVKEMKEALS